MTTAVQSPPGFQSLSRLGWNAGSTGTSGFSIMSSDEPNRVYIPARKAVTKSASSSSLASNNSTGSAATVTSSESSLNSQANGETPNTVAKKKERGGFWPVSKAESTSGISTARANGAVQPANSNISNGLPSKNLLQPAVPSQNLANGARTAASQVGGIEPPTAVLALLPMNGTFERKQINVPFFPEILKIGRQTNAKTVPTPVNGFFDSKVLSRQHAEVWAERNGKIWIRDVKSSNGTFVNGQRLSLESRESEPHELRQHDTLELGIDIVSEDQKTIVHHKVSAKVEFAGLPGNTSNVLDLNFGDLDPSHGGPLLASAMSQPMIQSRSRPSGPLNGRTSTPASVVGSQMTSAMQQRQANFWGSPLNVEQLVKHLSTEMRVAKQQAQDLDQVHTFLNSMMTSDGNPSKLQPPVNELSSSKHSNSRSKVLRTDHVARFGDPPAPPPQQPLPEKPDSAKSSPVNAISSSSSPLKRSDTAKPQVNGVSPSSATPQSSQILSLVNALEIAKKELDSQSSHIKQLEDMLKHERLAREAAEKSARKVEEVVSVRPITKLETDDDPICKAEVTEDDSVDEESTSASANEQILQQKLENVMAEMQRMKADMEQANRRAETAEGDASNARSSLAEMIERIKKENEASSDEGEMFLPLEDGEHVKRIESPLKEEGPSTWPRHGTGMANGHIRRPSRLPQAVESVVAIMLRDNPKGDLTAQSAPYVSMVGVVLIGVGLMAYLNSWQKGDK